MEFQMNGTNTKLIANAIHSFSRIGNELYMEADSRSGLILRAINQTQTAYSMIIFGLDFFASFALKSNNTDEKRCKLLMASCVDVFRNVKQVCQLI